MTAPRAPLLDTLAPRWVVRATRWLCVRWWMPRGLCNVWGFHNEIVVREIFGEPVLPVKWAHILGVRGYRADALKAEAQ